MNRLIKACLRYPTLTAILAIMAVLVGLNALMHMPRTEDPSITIRTGIVAASYPGATSEQVEKQVTRTLESHIFKFPEVRKEKTYSTSRPGLVVINVELEKNVKNTDVFWAKLRHEMNLARATELPHQVQGPVVDSDFGDTVAMLVAVSGDRYGYRELRDYVDLIKDTLRTVPEVGKIAVYGNQTEQIWVTSSSERMSQYFTDPRQVVAALGQRNVVQGAGNVRTDTGQVPLHTTGLFNTEEEIRRTMVGLSPTGQPTYIGDLAKVERRYQDPAFMTRYDGKPGLLVSVEMQKGHNIVEMGDKVSRALAQLRPMLPPDLHLDYIANQPKVVEERIAGLGHEFLIAIGCVILVTMLLLPMRVAIIAALAIPTTMLTTVGVMSAIGIQLHQVSIAALILVLGIVVDDAIVIADNYVELLDHQVPRLEAAWRAPAEVLGPVLGATLTIIASFLPLLIISGSAGEFIMALPITVAVALSVSFLVAIFLTPLLCRTFILKGLHDHSAEPDEGARKKFNALDALQAAYRVGIRVFIARPALAVGLGVLGAVAGAWAFRFVPRQFFPSAERNQFVIDVWMPQGSRIEATDGVARRIEQQLKADRTVEHCACFVGQSSPRFYYNVNPQQPDPAYAQFIVNTVSVKATTALVADLQIRLAKLAPEAMVLVQELQQGSILEAPLEFRISGDDIATLKALGEQVGDVLRGDSRARFVHTDYRNDSPMLDVDINAELANRLGVTHAGVSQLLSGGLDGAPISTFWEGDRAVNILLRLDSEHRSSFDHVGNTYVDATLGQGRVPLRAIASVAPAWQTSRIIRRNGVRTLTVRAYPVPGVYGSDILKDVLPRIQALPLPPGYRFALGGEQSNSAETLPDMIVALSISLLAIFLILMLQFRNILEPLVIMASIPLSLLGVVAGLLMTRNSFGFTAFMGMISLCGIVVRNAIILVDYMKEKLREGNSLENAARQAGERRLRPIFLTTMAAAVGVTPMILSGSKLWSPLASVLAIGLIFSMFFTLLVVPVLYVLVFRRKQQPAGGSGAIAVIALLGALLAAPSLRAAEPQPITLEQAITRAVERSSGVRIAQAKVEAARARQSAAHADYLPQLEADGIYTHLNNAPTVSVGAGALGNVPGLGPFPGTNVQSAQGRKDLCIQTVTLAQPLTQLAKIHHGNAVASAEERAAEADLRRMVTDIAYKTRQVYAGLLVAKAQFDAAEAGVKAAEAQDQDAQQAVQAGNALAVVQTGSRVLLLQCRQKRLAAESAITDLTAELDDLIDQPQGTVLDPAPFAPRTRALPGQQTLLAEALQANPELDSAAAATEKSRSALRAAKADYLPELTAYATAGHEEGVPFIHQNASAFGLALSWKLFDGGRKASVVNERSAQVGQASENQQRLRRRLEIDLGRLMRKVETCRLQAEVAEEACALRTEEARLAGNRLRAATISRAKQAEAEAAAKAARADLLGARLGLDLAYAELDQLLGRH
jgi:multidrug efflux pump subunit AcrB/outer membrane protein TolC